MNRKLLILLLCCVAVLVPSIASAQFFEKQKVVVWEVFDRNNDVKVAQSTKQQIRTSIVDAFVNSRNYEAFEANMNDVKSLISAKGLTPSPGNIATAIRELYGVDFVIFTTIKIIQHSNSFDEFQVHLSSDFFSTETQKSERMFYVDLKSDVNEIPSACAKLLAGLLGEQVSSQSSAPSQNQQWQSQQSAPQQSYQPATQPRTQQLQQRDVAALGNITLTKADLQRAGFRFAKNRKAIPVSGVHGSTNIAVESFSNGNVSFSPESYYSGYLNDNGNLCGLVLFRGSYDWSIAYCVDGEVAYPILEGYYNDYDGEKIWMLCVQETSTSYGIRRVDATTNMDDWSYFGKSYRRLGDEFAKIFGADVKTLAFLKKLANGSIDISTLNKNFTSYVVNGNIIPPSAWLD